MAESWPNYPESFYTGSDSDSSFMDRRSDNKVTEGATIENINFKVTYQADTSFDYGGTGTISGTVSTASKDTVPRASVSIRSKDWLIFAESKTDNDGDIYLRICHRTNMYCQRHLRQS